MAAAVSILRFLLVALSCGGYGLFLHWKWRVKSELLPVVVFSGIACIVYLGGLARLLLPAALLVFAGGLFLLGYSLLRLRPRQNAWRELLSPGMIVFLLLCCWFILFLRSARLYAYDDFSHWGLIVRSMLAENRFPLSAEVVTFPTYPPGSGVFAYYMGLLLGGGEGRLLMAQMFLQSACACSLFVFTGRGKRAILPCVLAGGGALLMLTLFQQALSTLLVDTLLPLLAAAGAFILLSGRKSLPELARAGAMASPVLAMTMLVKNNGLFFAAADLILLLVLFLRLRREGGLKKALPGLLAAFLLPVLLFAGWKIHLALTFPPEAQKGHHAMNIENYLETFREKSPELRDEITQKFLKAASDPATRNSKTMLTLTAASAGLLLLAGLLFRRLLKGTLRAILAAGGFYLLYLLGIWLMYLFSMSAAEAASFVSFNRYGISAVIFAVGIVTAGVLIDLAETDFSNRLCGTGAFCAAVALGFAAALGYCLYFCHGIETLTARPAYESTRPYVLDRALERVGLADGSDGESVLLYLPESAEDFRFSYYLTKYKLLSDHFRLATEVGEGEDFKKQIAAFDHFAAVTEDEAVSPYRNMEK